MKNAFNSLNLAVFLSLLILVLHYYIRTEIYGNWTNVLGWDVFSYYIYLPATFIYHDPGMVNQLVIERIFEQYQPSGNMYQIYRLPNGNWVSMYTFGLAILYAPFFFIAHAWALLSGGTYPADGFSFPYQYCIGNGVMLYIVSGIFIIRKVLLCFFSERIAMLTMIFLLLGTNYFHEATSDDCMPHAILFSMYALILWLTIRWHESPSLPVAGLLGLTLGFTILTRGSSIVLLAIPVLWNIYDKASFLKKWKLIRAHLLHLLVALLCAAVVPVLQMVFWKTITGRFIFDSYQNTEGFDWDGQHILKVLFSYKKSWFIYTPIIILPIAGIWIMRRSSKNLFPAVLVFFLLNFYLISAWAAWWQGGSFGMRYFVESYAVMAIPFGFFLKSVFEWKIFFRVMALAIAGFLTFLNLFQTWQFNKMMIDGYAMTKAYYWRIFLKTNASEDDRKLLEVQRGNFSINETFKDSSGYDGRTIAFYDFGENNSTTVDPAFIDTTRFVSPPSSCKLTTDLVYSPTFKMKYSDLTPREHAWIRISLDYLYDDSIINDRARLVINFEHGKHVYKYRDWILEDTCGANNWNSISVDYLTPYPLSVKDSFKAFVYIRGKEEVYLDNFRINAYVRKW